MSMNDVKIGVKQLNNVSAEWNGNFCSVTSWHNHAGADITMTNIPTISLDNQQIYSLLAVLSNYVLVNNIEKPNCNFESVAPQPPPVPEPMPEQQHQPPPEPEPAPPPPPPEEPPKFIEPDFDQQPPNDGPIGPDPGEDWKKKP